MTKPLPRADLPRTPIIHRAAARLAPLARAIGGVFKKTFPTIGILALLGCASYAGCAATKTVAGDVKTAVTSWYDCSKVNLPAQVKSTGQSLLKTVANDLVGTNFLDAIGALIQELGAAGEIEVACAVSAVDDVLSAGATSGAAALSPLELRAKEVIAAHHWAFGPPTSTTATPATTSP